ASGATPRGCAAAASARRRCIRSVRISATVRCLRVATSICERIISRVTCGPSARRAEAKTAAGGSATSAFELRSTSRYSSSTPSVNQSRLFMRPADYSIRGASKSLRRFAEWMRLSGARSGIAVETLARLGELLLASAHSLRELAQIDRAFSHQREHLRLLFTD